MLFVTAIASHLFQHARFPGVIKNRLFMVMCITSCDFFTRLAGIFKLDICSFILSYNFPLCGEEFFNLAPDLGEMGELVVCGVERGRQN
jgi:hypothetical protein